MKATFATVSRNGDAPSSHDGSASQDEFITLGQAGQIAPGRPSANTVWRWCRKGVRARSGERIRMQHVRAGGKIFSTRAWVAEFGLKLAEADAAYFDRPVEQPCNARDIDSDASRRDQLAKIDRELAEAGL